MLSAACGAQLACQPTQVAEFRDSDSTARVCSPWAMAKAARPLSRSLVRAMQYRMNYPPTLFQVRQRGAPG